MGITVTGQLMDFLLSLLVGAALGVVYDLFRIARILHKRGTALVAVEDALFFLFCALVTFFFLLADNSGVVRAFIILGEILGATIYYFTLGVWVMKLTRRFAEPAKKWVRIAAGRAAVPIRKAADFSGDHLRKSGTTVKKLFRNGQKVFKLCLQHPKRMLYNQRQTKNGKKADQKKVVKKKRRVSHENKKEA